MHSKVASEHEKHEMFDRERTINVFLKDLSIDGIRNGIQNKPGQNNLNVRFINVVNLYHSYKIKVQDLEYIDVDEKTLEKYKVMKNDIFFTRSSLRVEGIAHCNILLDEPQNMIFDDHIMRIRPNPEIINPYYLKLYCLAPKARKFFMRKSKTGTMTTIAQDDIGTLLVSVPKKEIQKRIATFFILIEERILKQQEKIEKLEQFKKGMMQKIFSQELRFKDEDGGEFPEWENKNLIDEADIYQPQTISQRDLVSNGYPVYGANGIIGFYSKYNHAFEQIVITCRGNTCGTLNFTKKQSWITGNAMVINIDNNKNINKKYLYFFLRTIDFTSIITGSGQPQITRSSIKKLNVKLPIRSEQEKIADYLGELTLKIEKEKEKNIAFKEQKKGFMKKMFI